LAWIDAAGSSGNHNGTDIVRIDQHVQASADCTFILAEQVRRFCDTVVRHWIQVGVDFGWTPESGDKVGDGNGNN
jgi:hypothetical protein